MARTRRALFIITIILSAKTAAAAGQEVESAQRHFDSGRALVRAGRCDRAVPEFRESIAASPNVGALLNLGECLEALGELQEAYESLRAAQALAAERRDERLAVARASAERVESKAVRVVINAQADASDLVVTIGGADVPRTRWLGILVSPNESHKLTAASGGRTLLSREVIARAGEVVQVTLPAPTEAPASPPPSGPATDNHPTSALKTVGIVTAAVGAATIATGSVFGVLALGARSDLEHAVVSDPRCSGGYPNGACDTSARRDLDPVEERAHSRATASTALFVAGGVLLAAGVTLVLVAPTHTRNATVSIAPAAGGMALGGAF